MKVSITALMVAAMAGLLAAAPAATASPTTAPAATAAIVPNTIQYVSKEFPGSGKVFGTVGCPAGTFVVNVSAGGGGVILGMAPIRSLQAPPRAANFTAAGVIGGASPDLPLVVQVGCLPAAQLADAVTVSKSFGTGSTTLHSDHQVDCPKDKPVAFGGGGYYLDIHNHYSTAGEMHSNTVTEVHESMNLNDPVDPISHKRPPVTGWRYRSFSHSATDKLVVSTQCAPLPAGYAVPHVSVGASSPFPNHALAVALCATGETALSGGMEDRADVYSSWQGNTNWQVVAGDAGPPNPLIARAQCIPGRPF